jgi:hypothetical protein
MDIGKELRVVVIDEEKVIFEPTRVEEEGQPVENTVE